MSLASDYAAAVVAAESTAPPEPFVGPNGRAEVSATGKLRIVRTDPGDSDLEIQPAAALALAVWINNTFG